MRSPSGGAILGPGLVLLVVAGCAAGAWGYDATCLACILVLAAAQAAERRQPLTEQHLQAQPACGAAVASAGRGSGPQPWEGARRLCPPGESGPEGPLAGAHLTPRFLWLLRSSAGLGPAPKPHPSCPLLDSHCPTRSCPFPAQAPPPASRHQDAAGVGTPRSDCAAADSPRPVGESGWGGDTPPLIHLFHPLPLLEENQESRLTPPHGFRIHSKADFPVSGSSPAAPPLKGAGPRGSWAWLRGAALAPPQDASPTTPPAGCQGGWSCSPGQPTPQHPIPSGS